MRRTWPALRWVLVMVIVMVIVIVIVVCLACQVCRPTAWSNSGRLVVASVKLVRIGQPDEQ